MWEEKDLLKMMKTLKNIFGEEIQHINSADSEFLEWYATNKIFNMLDYRVKCGSNLFMVTASRFGGIENIEKKHNFKLTSKQCVDIINFLLCGNLFYGYYDKQITTDYYTSKVIINYIEHNYPLNENKYIFEYKETK